MIPFFFGTFVPHIEQLPLFKAPWPFGSVAGFSPSAESLLMLGLFYDKRWPESRGARGWKRRGNRFAEDEAIQRLHGIAHWARSVSEKPIHDHVDCFRVGRHSARISE